MDDVNVWMLLFIVAAGFAAAFIDSVVGGGGLIAVPALLLTGLPPTVALGTNKLAGSLSTLTSTISFMKSGKVSFRTAGSLFPLSFIGAALGTYTVKQIPSDFLRPLVVVLLMAVTLYTLMNKKWGSESTFERLTIKNALFTALAALTIGFYDGFFGPGTGSFLLFLFLLLGFDFVVAAGNAKVLNFGSNVASLAMFILFDSVHYGYGIPMAAAMIGGSLAGSRIAIRKGASYIRPLFIGVTALLIGKQIWDLLQ